MKRILTQLLTGKDGETHDLGRWMGALSFLIGCALEIYAVVWAKQPFDFLAFGAGVAALAGGIGAMLKLKETTEPPPKE